MNQRNTILLIAIMAMAANQAIASVPLDPALLNAMSEKKTLRQATSAASEKRFDEDGVQSSQENKRFNNLRVSSQPQTTGNNPQTLYGAIDAAHAKRDDELESTRENALSNHMRVSSQPEEDYPQTLGEAVSAANDKRFDASFSSGSPAVAIVDRATPFRDANQQRIKEEGVGVEDADYHQSIVIESSKRVTNSDGHHEVVPNLQDYAVDTLNGRRDYALAESGCISYRQSVVGWIAASCLVVAQLW